MRILLYCWSEIGTYAGDGTADSVRPVRILGGVGSARRPHVARAGAGRRRAAWAVDKQARAAAFERDRHVVLPALVHPAQLAALRRYYRALVADGWVRLGSRRIADQLAAVERGTFDFDSPAHLLGPRDGADDGGRT